MGGDGGRPPAPAADRDDLVGRCPACGRQVAADAARCAACGADLRSAIVVLESGPEPAEAGRAGGWWRRRRLYALSAVALSGLLVAGLVASSGRRQRSSDRPVAPSAPADLGRSASGRPPPPMTGRTGLVVVLRTGRPPVARAWDVDARAFAGPPLPAGTLADPLLVAGALVGLTGRGALAVPLDGRTPTLIGPANVVFPSDRAGHVWLGTSATATEVEVATGLVTESIGVPARAAAAGALVVDGPRGADLYDRAGRLRERLGGPLHLLAGGGAWVASVAPGLPCRLRLDDVLTGLHRETDLSTRTGCGIERVVFAPDGRRLVALVDGVPVVVEASTGAAHRVAGAAAAIYGSVGWSSSGRWLLMVVAGEHGLVVASRAGSAKAGTLPGLSPRAVVEPLAIDR